jgi:general secretion pathway protein I
MRALTAKAQRGFSLLEVMVAIGILGLAVTVILSAQGGLAATNKSAANMGQAVTLGRCRMTEIEEKLLKLGFSPVDEMDSNRICCNDQEVPGFSCEWRIETVLLPPPPNTTSGDGGLSFAVGMDGGLPGIISGFASGIGTDGGAPDPSALLGGDGGLGLGVINMDAGLAGIGQSLTNGGGALGLLSMVFTIVYPSLKLVLEASIRRVTVVVKWAEGLKDRDFTLVQYVTNPMLFAAGANIDGGAIGDGGTPVATGGGAGGGGPATGGAPVGAGGPQVPQLPWMQNYRPGANQ